MFKKVSTEEIERIKKRLEVELEDKSLPFWRRKEVRSLIYHINTWLDWKDYQERQRYREVIQSES
jgi:plasmid replication initiation protein